MSDSGVPGHRKRLYKVGEVCRLTGLEGHVLRYWEGELPMLRPRKSRGGQRLYSPRGPRAGDPYQEPAARAGLHDGRSVATAAAK